MAEEHRSVREDRLEGRLESIDRGISALREDMAELKGEMRGELRPLTQRISNLEQNQRWVLGIILGTWVTLMLAVLFKG